MVLPAQTAALLSKMALGDLALGVVLFVVGATAGPGFLAVVGIVLVLAGGGMFTWARSQRTGVRGPIR